MPGHYKVFYLIRYEVVWTKLRTCQPKIVRCQYIFIKITLFRLPTTITG